MVLELGALSIMSRVQLITLMILNFSVLGYISNLCLKNKHVKEKLKRATRLIALPLNILEAVSSKSGDR